MAKLLLAVVLALFVATSEAAPNAACGNTGDAACADIETCENNKCKIKEGEACTNTQATCIGGATCGVSALCACPGTSTANGDSTKCEVALDDACTTVLFCETGLTCKDGTCKKMIGQACTDVAKADCMYGVCTQSVCYCPAGQEPLEDLTGCSGASFVAASFLSMVAMFVTTRLL